MLNIKNKKAIICSLLLIATLPIMMGAAQMKISSTSVAENKIAIEREVSTKQKDDVLVKKAESTITPAAISTPQAINTVEAVPAHPQSRGGLSNRTIRTLEYLVMDEAGSKSYECQLAIAELVMNRWLNGPYGGDLYKIMTAPSQFTGISKGYAFDRVPTEQVKQVVQDALSGKKTGLLTPDTYYCCVPENSADLWMLDPTKAEFVVEIETIHFYKPISK